MNPKRFWQPTAVAYGLTFGLDFFWNDTHDDVLSRNPTKLPTSVSQALANLSVETWSRLACEVLHCEPKHLDVEAVLSKIEETDTCLNLDSPVEVAIDAAGDFTVLVYDRDEP